MHQKLNQYKLVMKLAEKYSHSTYLASPINEPECQLVLTLFPLSRCSSPYERENLFRKAQSIKKLQHKHLVPILNIGVEEEQLFVVREYLPYSSLRSRLKRVSPRGLELRNALNLLLQVGEALVYAHGLQIFHSNLKPENIFFDANGQAILTDFNFISEHDVFIRDHIADEHPLCYMAPEQFVGTYDAKSDQYVLGCLAYELITGRPPFAVHNFDLMHKQHSGTEHVRLFKSDAHLPLSLEVAVLKSLAQDPDERFADFSLFIEIISFISSSLLTSTSPRPGNSHRKNISSLLMKAKEAENSLPSTKDNNTSSSLVPQIQYFSPIMQSSLGGMSEMLISSFIPQVTISGSANSTPLMPVALDNISAQKKSSFIPSTTLSEIVKPTPLMPGTLDNTSAWQHSSLISSATLSGPATPTPLTLGTFDNISAWQHSSFIPLSKQATPIPLAESYAPIFPFPFPEQSRERSRSQSIPQVFKSQSKRNLCIATGRDRAKSYS